MSVLGLIIILLIAVPLILVCVGFIMIISAISKNRANDNQGLTAMNMARDLNHTLLKMENRIAALENILAARKNQGGHYE